MGKGTVFGLESTWCKRGLCWGNHSTASRALDEEVIARRDILL
jgi:hypothetical protein